MELSIDTSTRYAAVGLSREGEALADFTWRSDRNHSVELVPAIQALLARARVEMEQLDAVFVAKGPGAFSALRVGMSTAKALAEALKVALVSVGTLDVEAQPYRGLGLPVVAVIEAGRSRVYVGSYNAAEQVGHPVYEVVSRDELASSVEAPTLFCGEGLTAVADIVRERAGDYARLAAVSPPTRRPSVLAQLGYERLRVGRTDDPATLQPMYLRGSQVDMAHRTWART